MSIFAERQAKKLELKRKLEEPEPPVEEEEEEEEEDEAPTAPVVVASGKFAEMPLLIRPKEQLATSVVQQRQKQIDIGKNTRSYRRYTTLVPRAQRTAEHPRTPEPHKPLSRRQFDGLMRKWRRLLHAYDDGAADDDAAVSTAAAATADEPEIEIDIRTLAEEWASIESELR